MNDYIYMKLLEQLYNTRNVVDTKETSVTKSLVSE